MSRAEIDDEVQSAARHGSFCPKMCTFACPVTAATGREDAVPWGFHRTVTDLAEGRLAAGAAAAARLTACTGCLACRVPCAFDQDVPDQVRAGRAVVRAAGQAPHAVDAAVAAVADGTSPYGITPTPVVERAVGTVVLAGCRDDGAGALLRLLAAAGEDPVVTAPRGCCGAVLRDLGASTAADSARSGVSAQLAAADRVVVSDPHCLPEVRAAVGRGTEVVHGVAAVARHAAAGRLRFRAALGVVTYHDPCLLARAEDLVDEPRALLRAAGAELAEPEHALDRTRCAGAGLGLELLDEPAAEATAAARRAELAAAGGTPVTACSGARRRLSADGTTVQDLFDLLADAIDPEEHM